MSPTAMVLFLVGAVVINVLVYGGVTWVYFKDKHRTLAPKEHDRAAPALTVVHSQTERHTSKAA